MSNKRKADHKAIHIEMPGPKWDDDLCKIEKCCNSMQKDGWTLLTMAWPDCKNVVLMFTRPWRNR